MTSTLDGTLHPQVARLLDGLARAPAASAPPTVAATRAGSIASTALFSTSEPIAVTWDTVAETPHGDVPLRWYQPGEARPDALLIYAHGGGWVAGNLDTHDGLCRALALRTGRLVVAIDYSLSPEAIFPQALNEVAAILKQAPALAAAAGFPVEHIAVAGDSAGAQLLATAMHVLAAAGDKLPDAAIFIYPVTDATMREPSWRTLAEGYFLTAEGMRWYWEQYLGGTAHSMAAHDLGAPNISPLYSDQLAHFPRTLVITAAFDLLQDEGLRFADRLAENGVAVERLHVPGQIHGFMRFRKVLTDPEWGPDAICARIGNFLESGQA